ncbi:MAG TPA: hypothetical protein VFA07_03860 [Chthonomonadaceae bacterium]|nr:hypothetical protein [Chthonomonadaceae bacterium]
MKREVNPIFAVVAAVVILVIAVGVYFYTGVASTHKTNLRKNAYTLGKMPQQPFIPNAP